MNLLHAEDLSQVLQQRKITYSFLRRIYEKEIPKELIIELIKRFRLLLTATQESQDTKFRENLVEFINSMESISTQNLDELKTKMDADYARLFLSINKIPPHPSESVYREGVVMQHSRDEVLQTYWSFGIDKKKEFHESEDHIAVEFDFMAYLCSKAIEALNNGSNIKMREYIQIQKDFLEKHLLKWVPKLLKDIMNTAQTPFYKAVAVLTEEYLSIDHSINCEILNNLELRR